MTSKSNKTLLKKSSIIEESNDSENTIQLKRLLTLYIEYLGKFVDDYIPEFEIRFGTKNIKQLTKIDFYNVVKTILNANFKLHSEKYSLKVITENENSNIRCEINGISNIQNYCINNNFTDIDISEYNFIEKQYFNIKQDKIFPIDFDDFNFRVAFQVEKKFKHNDEIIQKILQTWQSTKKIFRYIKRFEYKHPDFPILIHLSIVKMSNNKSNNYQSYFNIHDSNVFNNFENYEIEIELDNNLINLNSIYQQDDVLYNKLKSGIKYILIGLQRSNFPISISEEKLILINYFKIIDKQINLNDNTISSTNFIGPSSSTLQIINLLKKDNDLYNNIPNIRENYTVTDKADGERKLMIISNDGKIYLITTNMNVEFTGTRTFNKDLYNSIIDGEHILNNKKGDYINTYACFDIYFIKDKNVTGLPFIQKTEDSKETDTTRLNILNHLIKNLDIKSFNSKSNVIFNITIKKFYANDIFKSCQLLLNNIQSGSYEYNTDGLIFTPAYTSVGSNKLNVKAPNYRITWTESFKWKPPEYNTIDFLVKFKRNSNNEKIININFEKGIDMANTINSRYCTLLLYVGFDEKKHGYLNPFNDVINNINKNSDYYNKNDYKPALFYPTNPSDDNAHICNIYAKFDDKTNIIKIFTENNEEIEDNTIVEFKYIHTNTDGWKWIPIKVRNDKTYELRLGKKNYGNAYHVANSNWQSIYNPVTEEILKTGENISEIYQDSDVYYNTSKISNETKSMRDFHNLYIKNKLYRLVCKSGDLLIDYACGKGGDIPKWLNCNLQFILGIDINKDNIENKLDGVCARYLNYKKKLNSKNIPYALFLQGNTSNNIKTGEAFLNEKHKSISKAIFGEGNKSELLIGKVAVNNYGIAKNGFNVGSIQFALHYMFENSILLNSFLQNLSETININGYFIGTCYDGKKIFEKLKHINVNESYSIIKNSKKILEITKKYSNESFNDDETSLGYSIDVFQESINKTFKEYLVNFEYLTRLLENYGFVKLNDAELKEFNLNSSYDNFSYLFKQMNNDIQRDIKIKNNIGKAYELSEEEKNISFLNNYFIFKKIRNVNASEVLTSTLYHDNSVFKQEKEVEETEVEETEVEEEEEVEEVEEAEEEEEEVQLNNQVKMSIEPKTNINLGATIADNKLSVLDKLKKAEDAKAVKAKEKAKEKELLKQEKAEEKAKQKELLKQKKAEEKELLKQEKAKQKELLKQQKNVK